MRRQRLNVYLPPELLQEVGDLAARKKLSKSAIVEAAIASFLSPDGAERSEAALVRRLDLLTRQVQRLERTNRVTMETLALFVRFFLTVTVATRCHGVSAGKREATVRRAHRGAGPKAAEGARPSGRDPRRC
jgi:hypothetical protein